MWKRDKKMKISVLIPVYNGEKFIENCVYSVINQKFKDIEIIIINDGSSDNTGYICRELEKKYHNITYLIQKNLGVSAARNKGIQNAKGEYLLFLDSDDYLAENSLEKIYIKMKENDLDALTFDAGIYNLDGKKVKKIIPCNFKENEYISGYDYIKTYGYKVPVVAWMWILRHGFVVENNFTYIEGRFHEDVEWTAKWFPYAERIGYINAELYCQVLSCGSIMRSKNLKRSKDLMYISKAIYDNVEKLKDKRYGEIKSTLIKNASEEAFSSIHSACTMGYRINELKNEDKFKETIRLISVNKKYLFIVILLKMQCYFLVETIINIYDRVRRNR